jgi:hypothetical protein
MDAEWLLKVFVVVENPEVIQPRDQSLHQCLVNAPA